MLATYPVPGAPASTGLGAPDPGATSIASSVAPAVFVGCALGAVVGWTAASLLNLKYGPADNKGQHPLGQAIGVSGGVTLGALIAAGWSASCPAQAPCPTCPPPVVVNNPPPQNT